MPALEVPSFVATPTLHAFAANPSESAALGGKKAKTPIIAGSVCGGVMGLAWLIGFTVYFWKRHKRKQRKNLIAQGRLVPPKEKGLEREPGEKIVIPPDPAVLLGQKKPGEFVVPEHRPKQHRHAHSFITNSRQHSQKSVNVIPKGNQVDPPEIPTSVQITTNTHGDVHNTIPPKT